MQTRRRLALALATAGSVVATLPATAHASEQVGSNEHSISLIVNSRAIARVTYTTAAGQVVHALAWGAVNARVPTPTVPQVRFDLNFAGGWGSPYGAGYWRIMKNY